MKRITLSLALLLSVTFAGLAQQTTTQASLENTVTKFTTARSLPEVQQTANDFERLSLSDKTAWLPSYYASLVNTLMAFAEKDVTKKDALLDKADIFYQQAAKLQPKNEEIEVLHANIANARITVDPEKRWNKYGEIVSSSLKKAEKLNPKNPRVTLLKAQNIFYTPKEYGGGTEKALPVLQESLAQFSSFKPASSVHPRWGEDQAKQMLVACQKSATTK
ncbi:hypothetical protein SAMN02745146_3001 [Hymenobacter daecheongensis DSM 21074]|uniref:Uncharacterized protein n=1 Tax=Hymenobacter daecheongensis DSM 21074 TaxID=1121955 RepID=A0A1M6IWU9_9BACT|nr:hypothetical protein [Hymenobacter daecheongensis]SHJ38902.1 hypothetical protein SAMN02745146_3001 [Hymenobacter daecheongensis DSM 21074]